MYARLVIEVITMNSLYKNIRALRKKNNWSQDVLAKKMGYADRSMIAKIESGSVDLSERKIMEFSKVFNIEPWILMGFDVPIDLSNLSEPVTSFDILSIDEKTILIEYNSLNSVGQKEIMRYLAYATSISEYTKRKSKETNN